MPRGNNTDNATPPVEEIQEAQVKEEPKGPMIRFVGRNLDGKKINPPESLHGVLEILDLPSKEEQVAGFYHEKAHEITRTFPKMYKKVKFNHQGQPEPELEPEEDQAGEDTQSEVSDNG